MGVLFDFPPAAENEIVPKTRICILACGKKIGIRHPARITFRFSSSYTWKPSQAPEALKLATAESERISN
jgi:hypothetical protein